MRIAVLGTGDVGRTISAKLAELGHEVAIGTRDVGALRARDAGEEGSAAAWLHAHPAVRPAPFAEAAAHAEMVFVATGGDVTLEVLASAGAENLAGKVVLDLTNPLDFSGGFPPTLSVVNDDSLGEQIQRAFPQARVVKTLNTVTAPVMVNPELVGDGNTTVFVSGNDAAAKAAASEVLSDWFGWRDIIDLGDITTARGPEMWLALWVRLLQTRQTPLFNLKIVSSG